MPRKAGLAPSQPNQSVIGALECLEMVAAAGKPVSGRELSRQLGMDRVRVNRLLMTLAHCGVLDRTDAGRYRPGSGIHVLAALAAEGSNLQRLALPHLRNWLSEGFSVTLGVLWRGYICYLIRARPGRPLEESLGSHRGPALDSSAGLMLLASLPPARLASLPVETPSIPHVDKLSLEKLVARTRQDGYAHLHFTDGAISVGCPIGSPPVAALAVSARDLKPAEVPAVARRLRETADAIATQLAAIA